MRDLIDRNLVIIISSEKSLKYLTGIWVVEILSILTFFIKLKWQVTNCHTTSTENTLFWFFIFIVKTWYKKSIKRACKMTNRFIYNFQPIYGETLTKGEGRWSSLSLISLQLFATNKPSLPRPTSQPPFVVHRPES